MSNYNLIDVTTATRLKSFSAEAEEAGQLIPAQLDIIFDNNWLNIFVPEEFGGLQMGLPEALRLEEDLARIDGSLGWTVTLAPVQICLQDI